MILHKRRVLEALQGNGKRQLRRLLQIKARPKAPVINQSLEHAVTRHTMICQDLLRLMPELKTEGLNGASVCEIGPGDCLATAALYAGLGASRITLLELEPPVLSSRQQDVLQQMRDKGLPLDVEVIQNGTTPTLDSSRVSYHQKLMEDFDAPPVYDFIFSYDVLEHVEDLVGMFRTCAKILKPGGRMLHVVDLGGHGQFEDPLPPLDFQTYSDWLYGLMFPPGHRATRRFIKDYTAAATEAGLVDISFQAERTIDPGELQRIRPFLRPEAQARPAEEISIIEFVLRGSKAQV